MLKIKTVLVFVFLLILSCTLKAEAQFKSAMVGVNGLTCSACCRTVEMSIRKLPFVKNVEMNLDNTEGKITFNDTSSVDIEAIANAITDAGFSVRYLTASFLFSNVLVSSGYCFKNQDDTFQFINTTSRTLNGESQLKFIGKEFLSKDELKKYKGQLVNSCTDAKGKVYFVTL